MRIILLSLLACGLAACSTQPVPEKLILTPTSFKDLNGWQEDTPLAALGAFRRSCAALMQKSPDTSLGLAQNVGAWQQACEVASETTDTEDAARAYFEHYFQPHGVSGNAGAEGLFTGYYTPELKGSLQRTGSFHTPLYARPNDMISVDLGAFKTSLEGQHIVGKVEGKKLTPYDSRAEIAQGALVNRAQPIVWVDDPIDAFFLEIQGSGLVRLADDSVLPVGYDGANGRAYVAIGRALADQGELQRPVTMPSIRAWLKSHPERAQQMMNLNPSYVFFRRLPDENPLGAEGVALTPQRSVAVDPAFVPLGVPVWVDTMDGRGAPLRHLMITQDTGGAIKGPVRGDIFWGTGDEAAVQAGAMQSLGRYYILLPKTVTADDE